MLVLWPGGAPHVNAQTDKPASLTGAWIRTRISATLLRTRRATVVRTARAAGDRAAAGDSDGAALAAAPGVAGAGAGRDPEQAVRVRNAMRDLMNPSDRLTIVQTDSLIIITGSDGRTTRLSPDGKKVKDDSTKFEWKTKWDGAKLVKRD